MPTHLFYYVHQIGWGGLSLSSHCIQKDELLQRLHTNAYGTNCRRRQLRVRAQLYIPRTMRETERLPSSPPMWCHWQESGSVEQFVRVSTRMHQAAEQSAGSRRESPPDSCCSATWRCKALSVTSASIAPCLTSTVLLHSKLKMMPSSLGRSSLQA